MAKISTWAHHPLSTFFRNSMELSTGNQSVWEFTIGVATFEISNDRSAMQQLQEIFAGVEATLIEVASKNMAHEEIVQYLDSHKSVEQHVFTDEEIFDILVYIPFYSGFKAATVTNKMPIIRKHFPNWESVSQYDAARISQIMADPEMIHNQRKIEAVVKNAQRFRRLAQAHGSFHAYIDSFAPKKSLNNLLVLRQDLIQRFDFISKTTSYHFLCKIGMPVIKPDSAIRRVFHRLRLTESDSDDEYTPTSVVETGDRFVQATGHPHCYIDIVFAHYGQKATPELNLASGICLEDNPRCKACKVRSFCNYRGDC